MNRAIAISFLAGVVAGALAVGWMASRRDSVPRPAEPPSSPVPGDPATADADLEKLREDLRAAREQVASLTRELSAARAFVPSAAPPADPRRGWDSLKDRLRAGVKAGRLRNDDDPLTRELMLEAQSLLQDLARKKGWTLHEAYASPDGWPALVAMYLKDAKPPLTAEESAKLEEALAVCRRGSEALEARRKDLTGLEIIYESQLMSEVFDDALVEFLPDEHYGILDDIEELVEDMSSRKMRDSSGCDLPRDATRTKWTSEWGDILQLRDEQKIKLGPILEEYLDGLEALGAERVDDSDYESLRQKNTALMSGAQRRILERLGLDESQLASFRSWAVVYTR
ncbi:MAG: hypothetical protein AAB074_17710 [Planctomycetota bacterium]